ncbi:hypothetical protein CR513_61515, partial [Mucuna pruriens]
MKKILLASAGRLKSFSIRMVLEDDPNSLLQKAKDLNILPWSQEVNETIHQNLERGGPNTPPRQHQNHERGSLCMKTLRKAVQRPP